jgi:hypothetical protein
MNDQFIWANLVVHRKKNREKTKKQTVLLIYAKLVYIMIIITKISNFEDISELLRCFPFLGVEFENGLKKEGYLLVQTVIW